MLKAGMQLTQALRQTVQIKSYTELHNYLHNYDVFYKSERYKLKIPQWDAEENNRIGNIINNYPRKCSCNAGNAFICIAFILYAAYHFCKGGIVLIEKDEFIWFIIYAIFSAVTGKLLGLAYTRWQMIKFTEKLLKGKD